MRVANREQPKVKAGRLIGAYPALGIAGELPPHHGDEVPHSNDCDSW
jgi:hypothetical protein